MTKVAIGQSFSAQADHSSIECKADQLEINLDAGELGAGPAEAIRAAIAAGIRGTSERGHGGQPLWNRTGHLANDLRVEQQPDGSWVIAAPPDRLQEPALQQRLVATVPAVAAPLAQPTVVAAIDKTQAKLVTKRR